MTEPIRINRSDDAQAQAEGRRLGFGQIFTDHMFLADFQEEKGWYDPRVEPYGPISLDPAAAVLHYAQAIFDGLKAFRGVDGKIRLFRPQKHVERMNGSARRLCIPPLDPDLALSSIVRLVDVDRDWVPSTVGTSLYIRPIIIANEAFLGVRPAKSYIYFVILLAGRRLLSGGHGAGEDPGGGQVRARGGRRGGRRQDLRQLRGEPLRQRGGQAQGLHPGAVARRRAPEVPRRGRHHEHHGEDRRRGHHAAADRDHPARRDPRLRPRPAAQVGARR